MLCNRNIDLQKVPGVVGRRRIGKQANDERSYAAAWRWFLRGNVLSEHQRRIVTAFLALNCATSTTDLGDTLEEEPAKPASQAYDTARPATLIHGLVKRMGAQG